MLRIGKLHQDKSIACFGPTLLIPQLLHPPRLHGEVVPASLPRGQVFTVLLPYTGQALPIFAVNSGVRDLGPDLVAGGRSSHRAGGGPSTAVPAVQDAREALV
jgi:hypothetical protein